MSTAPRDERPKSDAERDPALTRRRLILAAERLIAVHGLEGVSLRQISAAAGQSNNFAVQYHFGDKEGLLAAIFSHRLPHIDEMRGRLLQEATAGGHDPDIRTLLDVLLLPLAREVVDPGSYYVSCNSRLVERELVNNLTWRGRGGTLSLSDMGNTISDMILERMGHLPRVIRDTRIRTVAAACLQAMALEEQRASTIAAAGKRARGALPFDVFVIDLLDAAAEALIAPLSPAASEKLAAWESGGKNG